MDPAAGILIRSTPNRWWMHALRVIGILTASAGAAAGYYGEEWGTPVVIVGGAVLALSETVFMVKAFRRRWCRDTGNGFVITDRAGEREYRDDQARGTALSVRTVYSQGSSNGIDRRFRVIVEQDGRTEAIDMVGRIPEGTADPLAALIKRITDLLLDRARKELDSGREVRGDGWALEKTRLTAGAGGAAVQLAIDAIAAVDVFDEKVCVWRMGEAEPAVRIPANADGAYLLEALLRERLPQRKDQAPPADGLGRILFERKPRRFYIELFRVGGILVAVLGVLALIGANAGSAGRDSETAFTAGAWMTGIGLLCAVGGWAFASAFFRCHEYGVRRRAWAFSSEKQMQYREMAAFTYSAVRHYHNGVYMGTQVSMTFTPVPGSGKPGFSYGTTVHGGDEEINGLRAHIAGVIGARMGAELAETGETAWTPTMRITREGIVYRPSGIFRTGDPVLLKWEDLKTIDIDQGYFYLWSNHQEKHVHSEDISAVNFFPGFALLSDILTPDEEPGAPTAAPAEPAGPPAAPPSA
jgi:hypothetical protein